MTAHRKSWLGLALAGLWAASAAPLYAADNGAVDVQVTVATPCIIVSPASLDYGTLAFGGSGSTGISYTNCGPANERVFVKGTDATGTSASWALNPSFLGGASCGDGGGITDAYRLQILSSSDSFAPLALNETEQFLETVPASTAGLGDYLDLTMPCTGSGGAGETMTFQVIFTAAF